MNKHYMFPSWTPVLTDKGLRKIEDIRKNDKVFTSSGFKNVKSIIVSPGKDLTIRRTKTYAGTIYSINNNTVLCEDGEMCPVDCDSLITGYPCFPIEEKDNKEFVFFGMLAAGSQMEKNLTKIKVNRDQFCFLEKNFAIKRINWENETTGIASIETGYIIKKYANNEDLDKILKEFLLLRSTGSGEKSIIESLMYRSYTETRSILKGLFSSCGGSIKNPQLKIFFGFNSKKMAEQVQLLLSSVGISSVFVPQKIMTTPWATGRNYKKDYVIEIQEKKQINKFIKEVGVIGSKMTPKDKDINTSKIESNASRLASLIVEKRKIESKAGSVFSLEIEPSQDESLEKNILLWTPPHFSCLKTTIKDTQL